MTRSDTLFIERPGDRRKGPIHVGRRIGVDYAGEWASKPLRFYRADCPHVSRRLKDDRPLEH
jgi:DNA-3-methyladenine glycosylase